MRIMGHSIFSLLLLLSTVLLALGGPGLQAEVPAASAPAATHSLPADSAYHTPDSLHAVAAGAETHGESAEEGHSVIGILAHHLTDSNVYEFLFWKFNLPVIAIGSFTLPVTKHTIMLATAAILVFLLFAPLRKIRGAVPHGLNNFLEMIIIFLRDQVVYPSLGEKDGRKYLPFFLTAFFFILFSNLLGMIPYGSTPTGNISVTGALAGISLLVMIGSGVVRHGPLGYLGSFVPHGVPIFIAPILFPIEIIGVLVKHFALAIRLFANMLAGHAVIAVFLALISSFFIAPISIIGAVAISLLELFVAFLQAYIFTMLSSLFIGGALHPEH